MSDRTCPCCSKLFKFPTQLRRHLSLPNTLCKVKSKQNSRFPNVDDDSKYDEFGIPHKPINIPLNSYSDDDSEITKSYPTRKPPTCSQFSPETSKAPSTIFLGSLDVLDLPKNPIVLSSSSDVVCGNTNFSENIDSKAPSDPLYTMENGGNDAQIDKAPLKLPDIFQSNNSMFNFDPTEKININDDMDLEKLKTKSKECPNCCLKFKHHQSRNRHVKNNICNKQNSSIDAENDQIHLYIEKVDDHEVEDLKSRLDSTEKQLKRVTALLQKLYDKTRQLQLQDSQASSNGSANTSMTTTTTTNNNNQITNTDYSHNQIANTDNSHNKMINSNNQITNMDNSQSQIINSNNTITNVINQYISPLGLEDMSFIKAKDILKIFEKGFSNK
jgi:hypothetical protein